MDRRPRRSSHIRPKGLCERRMNKAVVKKRADRNANGLPSKGHPSTGRASLLPGHSDVTVCYVRFLGGPDHHCRALHRLASR